MHIHALSSITHNSRNVEATQGSTDRCVVYTHKGILFSLKKEFPTRATNWMNLREIILTEISQDKKGKLVTKTNYLLPLNEVLSQTSWNVKSSGP